MTHTFKNGLRVEFTKTEGVEGQTHPEFSIHEVYYIKENGVPYSLDLAIEKLEEFGIPIKEKIEEGLLEAMDMTTTTESAAAPPQSEPEAPDPEKRLFGDLRQAMKVKAPEPDKRGEISAFLIGLDFKERAGFTGWLSAEVLDSTPEEEIKMLADIIERYKAFEERISLNEELMEVAD